MIKAHDIANQVITEIIPSKKEETDMKNTINRVSKIVKSIIKPLGLKYTISGSFIRNTWLSDKREFDLFILFPKEFSKGELQEVGLSIGKKTIEKANGTYEVAYAEHPYTRGKVDEYEIDIVPCYEVESTDNIISSVDRTPFHNKFMKKQITKKLSNEVRLLKKFTKSIGIYGSDVKTQGFSGYLCEILIIDSQTFINLMKIASSWNPGHLIDIEKHCAMDDAKNKFRNQPLIAIDPTDSKRNVAAALSSANFALFVKSCELFMEKPSRELFFMNEKKVSKNEVLREIKSRKSKIIGLRVPRPETVNDILWSQMRKTSRRITNILKEYEFDIIGNFEYADDKKVIFLWEMEIWSLPAIRKVEGPPFFNKKHSGQFIAKYKDTGRVFVEGNNVFAEVERLYRTPKSLINYLFKKDVPSLIEAGIASKIAETAPEYTFLTEEHVIKEINNNTKLRKMLNNYLNKSHF